MTFGIIIFGIGIIVSFAKIVSKQFTVHNFSQVLFSIKLFPISLHSTDTDRAKLIEGKPMH